MACCCLATEAADSRDLISLQASSIDRYQIVLLLFEILKLVGAAGQSGHNIV